ncbi:MAG: flagella cluster protein [Halanaeroarchaeum sp.]
MAELDVSEGFDLHEHREQFKLLRQDDDAVHVENRGDLECPACGSVFDRLFATGRDQVTFNGAPSGPMCLVRTPEQLLVLTH